VRIPDQSAHSRDRVPRLLGAAVALAASGALLAACAAVPVSTPGPSATEPASTPPPAAEEGFGLPLDVPPDSPAAAALADPASTLSDRGRRLIEGLAKQPTAVWITSPKDTVAQQVLGVVEGAASRGAIPVLVAYNIPDRDCGGHSATGTVADPDGYRAWVEAFAAGLAGHRAVVIVEPDAISQMDCLDDQEREERLDLLREATTAFVAAGADVYIDAGHSAWLAPDVIAERLLRAGVEQAAGFSLNVSNFRSTEQQIDYGREVASRLPGEPHVVIDTSRNGWPSDSGEWCNPWDRALGAPPTTDTGDEFVDAFLWIKTPGQSDGECNGGPPAGQWWSDYALMLADNATPD